MTPREKDVVDAAHRGTLLVCGDLSIEELAVTEDPRYVVRADLIRELLLDGNSSLDPRGIRLGGARITGTLDLDYVSAQVPLTLIKSVVDEPLRLAHAQLRRLNLSGSRIVALFGDGLRVSGGLILRDGFRGSGSDPHGIVRLLGAHITGNLEMDGAQLHNQAGPALNADRLRVDGSVFLRDGFRAVGSGGYGNVRLVGAHITGSLDMSGAIISRASGVTVDLGRARVEAVALIPAPVVCPAGAKTTEPCAHPERRVGLNEFTYGSLGRSSWQQWLHLIRCHTNSYDPTPYQRLAGAERTAGHDNNARRILMAQQRDLRARGDIGGWLARLTHSLWGWVAGYGYRARRTAVALLLALALAGGLGFWAGHWPTGNGHHAVERTATFGNPAGTPCSVIEQIGLGIDRGLPLAPAGIRSRCDLDTGTTAGQWFTLGIWVLQALVWALATLALVGYTGLIRKIT